MPCNVRGTNAALDNAAFNGHLSVIKVTNYILVKYNSSCDDESSLAPLLLLVNIQRSLSEIEFGLFVVKF